MSSMNLLRITRTPIKIQMSVKRASLEMKRDQPRCEIDRTPGGFQMKSENIKVRLDTFEMRKSTGLRTARGIIEDAYNEGGMAASEATGDYVDAGNQMAQMVQVRKGGSIADIYLNKILRQRETVTTFMPSVGPEISWQSNSLDMQYNPTKLNFDWKGLKNSMEYIPGELKFNILQYPKVDVEYIGSPNYVPPSANPDYIETK